MGAHFEALDEGVLIAALKLTGYFFPISISLEVWCTESAYLELDSLHYIFDIIGGPSHRTFREIEMAKKYPVDFEAAERTPSSRALK